MAAGRGINQAQGLHRDSAVVAELVATPATEELEVQVATGILPWARTARLVLAAVAVVEPEPRATPLCSAPQVAAVVSVCLVKGPTVQVARII